MLLYKSRPWLATHTASLHVRKASNLTTPPDQASIARLPDIDVSKLEITQTKSPKSLLPSENLVFGREFSGLPNQIFQPCIRTHLWFTSDHMMSIEWTSADGWFPPRIIPYQNLSLDPATCVFHYGFEAFEGMKAYKDSRGHIRLFRPDKNMARLNKSVARIALPTFSGEAFIELIKKFVQMEERFIPT